MPGVVIEQPRTEYAGARTQATAKPLAIPARGYRGLGTQTVWAPEVLNRQVALRGHELFIPLL